MQSIDKKVISRIYGKKRGWVFTPNHFKDLGSRQAIGLVLHRLAKKGTIRNIARGLYDYPKTHPKLGVLSPSVDAIVSALKDRDSVRVMPTGAYAANLLGLSTQVPMRVVYLTDGKGRKVRVGNRTIELINTSPRNMATSDRVTGLVIQALRSMGKDHVDNQTVKVLRRKLSDSDRKRLLKDVQFAPAWMGPIFRAIAAD
ncbi:MAG: DUF6088 family protein [Verrucomicrobia bacterium]|nr:DUF6088 family protein [Verrucomicrobiota bacterium]MDA1065440.1 DUF6088 family protein [Verrucomicrobiota bacterium]